jgi:hypothetical protein
LAFVAFWNYVVLVVVVRLMPLAIDLFCGLGGWAEGLLAEGYDVIGFKFARPKRYAA